MQPKDVKWKREEGKEVKVRSKVKNLPLKSARQDRNRKKTLQRFLGMQVLRKWEHNFNTEPINLS